MSLKLCLGAGGNRPAGFECHDIDVDITKPLPWKDNSVDYVHAEHVCEHISTKDFFNFMFEVKRILIPGGTFRLCIPVIDFGKVSDRIAVDLIINHGHVAAYTVNSVQRVVQLVGWSKIFYNLDRNKSIDGHWRAISEERDLAETYRMECIV